MKYRKVYIHIVLTLVIFLLLPVGHRHPAFGNSTPEATDEARVNQGSPEQVAKDADELLVRINRVNDEAGRYENALDAASGEDRLVLLLQINRLQKRVMADIHQLVEALLFLEKSGKQAELRERVERLCQDALPSLWSHINRLRGEIDTVRARRVDAAPENRLAIENEIAYHAMSLDPLYEISLVCINDMERLDMAVEKVRAEFTKLLSDRFGELFGRTELALYRIKDLEEQAKEAPDDATVAT